MYTILITPAAINDIDETITYYNEKSYSLGFMFSDEVDANFKSIALNPDAFSKRYKDVRGKLLKRFPYLILYRTNNVNASIEVLRLFNTYQNPYWH